MPVDPAAPPGVPARVVGGLIVAAGAIELAIVEAFFVPLRVGRWPLPLVIVAAAVGNVALARLMYRATRLRGMSLVPGAIWLVVALVLAAPRGEEVVIPGTWQGLGFLFVGSIAAAFGAAGVLMPRPPGPSSQPGPPPPSQRADPNRR